MKEDPNKPHKTSLTVSPMPNSNLQGESYETVLLLDSKKSLAYQFTFRMSEDKSVADRFIEAVGRANATEKKGKGVADQQVTSGYV